MFHQPAGEKDSGRHVARAASEVPFWKLAPAVELPADLKFRVFRSDEAVHATVQAELSLLASGPSDLVND